MGCIVLPNTYAIDADITYKNRRDASAMVPQRAQGRDSDAGIVSYDENTTFPIPPIIRKKL